MKIPYETGQGVTPTGGSTANIDMTAINTQKNIFDSLQDAGQTVYDINAEAVASEHLVAAKLRLHELTTTFSGRTDYQTFGSDFETASDSIFAELSQNIDPRLLPDFKANFQNAKLTNFTKVTALALAGVQDKAKASLDANLIALDAQNGDPTTTKVQRQGNIAMGRIMIANAVANKVITAEEGVKIEEEFISNYTKSSIQKVIRANPEMALDLLQGERVFQITDKVTGEIEYATESDLSESPIDEETQTKQEVTLSALTDDIDDAFLSDIDRDTLIKQADSEATRQLNRQIRMEDRQDRKEDKEKKDIQVKNYSLFQNEISSFEPSTIDEDSNVMSIDNAQESILAFNTFYQEMEEEIRRAGEVEELDSGQINVLMNQLNDERKEEDLEYLVSVERDIDSGEYTAEMLEKDATPIEEGGNGIIQNTETYNRISKRIKTYADDPLTFDQKNDLDIVKNSFNIIKSEDKLLYGGYETAEWAWKAQDYETEFLDRVLARNAYEGKPPENSRKVALEIKQRFRQYYQSESSKQGKIPPFTIPKETKGDIGSIDVPSFKRVLTEYIENQIKVTKNKNWKQDNAEKILGWISFVEGDKLLNDDINQLMDLKESFKQEIE